MEKRFIVVSEVGEGYAKSTRFSMMLSEKGVIEHVTDVNSRHAMDEPEEVQRVFSVDEHGNVKHYELVLEGFKLVLKEKVDKRPKSI